MTVAEPTSTMREGLERKVMNLRSWVLSAVPQQLVVMAKEEREGEENKKERRRKRENGIY
ncbi:conserved hypothetical protein [Ricinus communis]|uniref:Uncharacterized protein n=1 Tax=Ricinus communis TaxID=3988 RepID=B9RUY9_RICCO|nr:conserved hypothetical protein [Ricinus communis]